MVLFWKKSAASSVAKTDAMITYPRTEASTDNSAPPVIRVIGLGNAGVHLADRLAMAGHFGVEVIAMNTDAQSLASSVAAKKITVGTKATRGLGAGGDPEVGYEAAQESLQEIRTAVEGAQILFVCAGLGGGTAGGIAPLLAETAREAGATVIALVTSPFSFEGKRRSSQAAEALSQLARHTSALLHFENDRMAELTSPRSGIEETFATSDSMLSASITALIDILRGGGPMPVGLSDILAVLGGGSPASLFGRGAATGDNRAHEALERAIKGPLLDRGRMLAECNAVIAHISGPSSLSFAEVAAVMRELTRHTTDDARLFLGVTVSTDAATPLSVTLFGNYVAEVATPARDIERPAPVARPVAPPPEPEPAPQPAAVKAAPVPSSEPPSKPLFPEPEAEPQPVAAVRPPKEAPAPKPKPAPQPKVKQESLNFESVARGRFEKSEPTIVEGEDLDVPTFLRMRGKSK